MSAAINFDELANGASEEFEFLNPGFAVLGRSVDRPCKLGIKIDAILTSHIVHPVPAH
jgi:hypothetical protein